MNMNDMPLPSHLDAADPYRFTTVAHRAHRFGGPLSDTKAAVMVELLGLHARSQVLDLGCGKANLLAMVLQRWGCSGLGVDVNPHFVAEAKRAHFALVAGGRLKLLEQSGGAVLNKGGEFDAALCLGAAHYLGGLQRLLTDLRRCLNRGAVVLVGEGYWAKAPAPAFLDLIAGHEDQMGSHAENAQRARVERWQDGWLRWGRDTLGFGYYVLRLR
jgi:SAM-dependent methyltransferase